MLPTTGEFDAPIIYPKQIAIAPRPMYNHPNEAIWECGLDIVGSFQNLRSIVCWNTKLQQDDEVQDIAQKKRVLKILPPQNPKEPGAYTRFFLDDPYSPNKIEVIVLKLYLKERLQLEFKPRDLSLPV